MSITTFEQQLTDSVVALLRRLPKERRGEAASHLLALGYELSRGLEGDEFMRGWLEAALADLETRPPKIVIREAH